MQTSRLFLSTILLEIQQSLDQGLYLVVHLSVALLGSGQTSTDDTISLFSIDWLRSWISFVPRTVLDPKDLLRSQAFSFCILFLVRRLPGLISLVSGTSAIPFSTSYLPPTSNYVQPCVSRHPSSQRFCVSP